MWCSWRWYKGGHLRVIHVLQRNSGVYHFMWELHLLDVRNSEIVGSGKEEIFNSIRKVKFGSMIDFINFTLLMHILTCKVMFNKEHCPIYIFIAFIPLNVTWLWKIWKVQLGKYVCLISIKPSALVLYSICHLLI